MVPLKGGIAAPQTTERNREKQTTNTAFQWL
jgi:hypothetical protein